MRLYSFGPQVIAVAAAALLVAACDTAPEAKMAAAGTGATAPAPAKQMSLQEELVVNVGDRVFYDTNKFDLKPQARATLDRQAAFMKKYPQARFVIEGNCDERGTREYNLALGERRANGAKAYLVNQGIAANRLTTISYGKERPVALGHNEAAWAQNRRSVTVVSN